MQTQQLIADADRGRSVSSAHAIEIRVTDNGPGIDKEFLPRVFEKFEKDSFSSGTGLGLYVVRLMAEAIDASVSVVSSASGTTFQVSVPRATPSPAERLSV